ncbi:four-carbon acid sugar kinase family protein [Proteinivorax tanatarense]|uniref:Four-carbon acid sugar kinase family protein n=1 Tax=Proteinivorax tanatarense TaxID=1260629 RepID=A0AAU7VMF4_9FIRM
MSKVVIIADDLTGANATGVLLARKGFKTGTYLNIDRYSKDNNCEVISISTDSRAISAKNAYQRVQSVAQFFKDDDVSLFANRIDSTLRGNIGAETEALLDILEDHMAIVVCSFPSSGRTSVGGYLTVDSLPLEKTAVAQDPKTPISQSYIPQLIQEQTDYPLGFIPLKVVLKGCSTIAVQLAKQRELGNRIVVVDATTDEDIKEIAKATRESKINAISVDPGPFTSALASQILEDSKEKFLGQKTMFVVGSVTDVTRGQLEELKLKHRPLTVKVSPMDLIYDDIKEKEIERATKKLLQDMDSYKIIGVATTKNKEGVLNLPQIAKELKISEDDVANRISKGLGEITKRVMKESKGKIGGLYTSGGDVTVAVCHSLQSAGIEVKDEVLPLAAYGKILGGSYENTPIITKGGLIGDSKAMITALEYLLTKISTNQYSNKEEKIDE